MPSRSTLVVMPVAVAALMFWRGSLDVFNTAKLSAALITMVLLAAASAGAAALRGGPGRAAPPRGWWPAALLGFVAALLVGVAVSDTPLRSVVGLPGRHGGLVVYAAVAAIALAAAVAVRRGGDPAAARSRAVDVVLMATVPIVVYALLQAIGADPLVWSTVEGGVPVFATFGNVDFASAWMGVVGVLATGVALEASRSLRTRRLAGALAGGCAVASSLTGSLQGPVIMALALPVLLVAGVPALRDLRPRLRIGGIAAVLVLLVAASAGPLRAEVDAAGRSLETRLPKWEAAIAMSAASPLVGHGLDSFGDLWFSHRSEAVAAEEGLRRSVDNAHSLPLQLLVGGGLLLLTTWLAAFVILPALTAWRARRRLWRRPEGLSVAMALGGWFLASLVSIDVPPLALLGGLLTGLVLGEWAAAPVLSVPSGAATGGGRTRRRVLAAAAAVLLVAAIPLAARPLHADSRGWQAELARLRADPAEAARQTARASALAPWSATYEARQGEWLAVNGVARQALVHLREARRRAPADLAVALNLARVLAATGDPAAAAAYDHVLTIDDRTPEVLAEVADFRAGADARADAGGSVTSTEIAPAN